MVLSSTDYISHPSTKSLLEVLDPGALDPEVPGDCRTLEKAIKETSRLIKMTQAIPTHTPQSLAGGSLPGPLIHLLLHSVYRRLIQNHSHTRLALRKGTYEHKNNIYGEMTPK